ncbi:MAG: helix-turn-helix transcriptional regulator [Acidobacteria bacterium]|nr:helix-turn-helix transcriptional regulator [Acidobacteriota bacterium]
MKKTSKNELLVMFGIALRNARKENGLSQEELAHKANLDRTYIGGVERGERNISLLNLLKISHALKTPIYEILRELEQKDEFKNFWG